MPFLSPNQQCQNTAKGNNPSQPTLLIIKLTGSSPKSSLSSLEEEEVNSVVELVGV